MMPLSLLSSAPAVSELSTECKRKIPQILLVNSRDGYTSQVDITSFCFAFVCQRYWIKDLIYSPLIYVLLVLDYISLACKVIDCACLQVASIICYSLFDHFSCCIHITAVLCVGWHMNERLWVLSHHQFLHTMSSYYSPLRSLGVIGSVYHRLVPTFRSIA